MLQTLAASSWTENFDAVTQNEALTNLEAGKVLFLPTLNFQLHAEEQFFLNPQHADPQSKNISYHPLQHKLWGVQRLNDQERIRLKSLLDRFAQQAHGLLTALIPAYAEKLVIGRTSFRPVEIAGRQTSYRKDDKRLHVDAFPSAPNQGNRILRLFSNINPNLEPRIWRLGEPFEQVAQRFIPDIPKPVPGSAALLRLLRITKSKRTLYDHYMLHIHDSMKGNDHYQKTALQQEIAFPAQSSWIVQTDQVSHAAMRGQHVLEQTFYLPVDAMKNQSQSPLRILEKTLGRPLV